MRRLAYCVGVLAAHLGGGNVYVPKLLMLEKGALKGDELETDSDESIDLDDNPYLYSIDDSESDSDSDDDDYYK